MVSECMAIATWCALNRKHGCVAFRGYSGILFFSRMVVERRRSCSILCCRILILGLTAHLYGGRRNIRRPEARWGVLSRIPSHDMRCRGALLMARDIRISAQASGFTSVCFGLGAWAAFVLVERLSETLWGILMCLGVMALLLSIYAARRGSKWWLASAAVALLLIVGLLGAVAG